VGEGQPDAGLRGFDAHGLHSPSGPGDSAQTPNFDGLLAWQKVTCATSLAWRRSSAPSLKADIFVVVAPREALHI
jgi:hypothetical protein